MSLVNPCKIGNCSRCPSTNTQCRKRGKDLVCLSCCHKEDIGKQLVNQRVKFNIRSLAKVQDKGQSSYISLIHDLDAVLSLYIRVKDADKNGMVKCFCCPRILHYTLAQNSHYIRRGHMATRFLIENCHQSCPKCNNDHNDNIEPYRKALIEERGSGIIDWLEEQSKIVCKHSQDELKEMLIDFREKLRIAKLKFQKPVNNNS